MTHNLIIAKIVGASGKFYWAQNHVFEPEQEAKKLLSGSLIASLEIRAKSEEIDTTSFGKEIISRFHEIYYSSNQQEILLRIKLSLESLVNEFSDRVEIEITAGVVIEKNNQIVLYAGLLGSGKVAILRQQELGIILEKASKGVKTCSGYLKNNDLIVLATSQFFETISLDVLKAALGDYNVSEAAEQLAPRIHASKDNSQTAAVIFKAQISKEEKLKPATAVGPKTPSPFKKPLKERLLKFPLAVNEMTRTVKSLFQDFQRQPDIFIRDKERKIRAKKTTLTVALILIILLLVSVFFGSRRKSFLKEFQKSQSVYQEAEYKYKQAGTLIEINPLRARLLLDEAKNQLQKEIDLLKDSKEKQNLTALLTQIEGELEKVAKEYKFDKADIYLDLTLAKEGFKGSSWAFSLNSLQILDQDKGTILGVELESKTTSVTAGGEKLSQAKKIGASENNLFLLKKDKILAVDKKRGEVAGEQDGKDWGEIVDLRGFAENAYLLDPGKGKIWKYAKTQDGLGIGKNYLSTDSYNLNHAVSLAIDGSVFVLFSDGTIIKFTRGIKDNFNIAGFESEFKEPEKIYTDENLDNLYVLDRQNTRIVVISKDTGEYQSSYVWPGIAGAKDIFASEKEAKILLLTGEKIYEIPLR